MKTKDGKNIKNFPSLNEYILNYYFKNISFYETEDEVYYTKESINNPIFKYPTEICDICQTLKKETIIIYFKNFNIELFNNIYICKKCIDKKSISEIYKIAKNALIIQKVIE